MNVVPHRRTKSSLSRNFFTPHYASVVSKKLNNIPVTLDDEFLEGIDLAAKMVGENRSTVMRMAIRLGIPLVLQRLGHDQPLVQPVDVLGDQFKKEKWLWVFLENLSKDADARSYFASQLGVVDLARRVKALDAQMDSLSRLAGAIEKVVRTLANDEQLEPLRKNFADMIARIQKENMEISNNPGALPSNATAPVTGPVTAPKRQPKGKRA